MSYFLSVDLGTTFSAAAINEDGKVEIFPLGSRSAVIPSVVALRADGTVLTGEAAERRGISEPTRVGREFKRRLGDPTPLVIGGTPYGAETLMAELLRAIVARVSEQKLDRPAGVVLSHPANYGPYKLDLLTQVGHLAEVANVEFIPEPEAAAAHYLDLNHVEPGDVVAVYDLGGGTYDVALVRRTDTAFELVGTPDGMERFGGIDLDEAVFDHVRRSLGRAMDELDPHDPAVTSALVRLREDCREAKEGLSSDTDAAIPVMLPNLHTEVRLTRAEFEDLIRPRLRETMRLLERVVQSSGLQFDDLAQVLLVGGSSRIPLVAEMVVEATGRPVALGAHPKHAIALGAATVGHVASPVDGAAEVAEQVDEPDRTPAAAEEPEIHAEVDQPVDSELDLAPISEQPEPTPRPKPERVDPESPPSAAPPPVHRPLRRRILMGGVAAVVVAAAVVGATFLGNRGASEESLPPDEVGPAVVPELVVPVRIGISHGEAALMLTGGASWAPLGPVDVNGPHVAADAGPEGIVISNRSDEPLAEAVFEVTFRDIGEVVHFVVERSDPSVIVEIAFPASPQQRGFVADGDLNPIEFQVLRDDMTG